MNRELVITIRDLVNKHGIEIYTDSKKLKAFLNDLYPEKHTREKRLIIDSIDEKIPENIMAYDGTEIDDVFYNNLVRKLYDNLGISQDLAENAVDTWCQIFDKMHIKVINNFQGPMNMPYNGSNTNCNGYNQGYSNVQSRPGMPLSNMNQNFNNQNFSNEPYDDKTVFINNQANNNKDNTEENNSLSKNKKIIIGAAAVLVIAIGMIAGYYGMAKEAPPKNTASKEAQSKPVETKTEVKSEPEQKKQPRKNATANNFIFKDSSTNIIESSRLYNLTSDQLYIARNEIFARHGYIFKEKTIQSYFENQMWYNPEANAKGETSNEIEKKNVDHIKAIEEVKFCFKNAPAINRNFIFDMSSITKLQTEDIERLSNLEMLIARNEIFARHGYIFGIPELKDYFETKRWYVKGPSNDFALNDIENYNVELINQIEDKRVYNMLYHYTLGNSY